MTGMGRKEAATLSIYLDRCAPGTTCRSRSTASSESAIIERILHPNTRIASSRGVAADLCVSRTTTQLALD
jgi:hypothetical protein